MSEQQVEMCMECGGNDYGDPGNVYHMPWCVGEMLHFDKETVYNTLVSGTITGRYPPKPVFPKGYLIKEGGI